MDNLIFTEKIARRKTKFRSPLQNQIEQRYAEKILRNLITCENRLSDRENAVAIYLSKCCEVDAISDKLSISPETVVTHRKNIYSKLDIHCKGDLVRWFVFGMLKPYEL